MSRAVKLDPNKPTLVLFHKIGCPACEHLMPIWNAAKKIIKGSKLAVVQEIARNNEPVDSFMKSYQIVSYPTIILFHHGKSSRFQAERTVDNLVSFVERDGQPVENNKPIVLFLHWEACGHCHAVRPVWDQLVNEFQNDSSIQLRDYEATAHPQIMQKYNVNSFPTFLRVQGTTVMKHEGGRSYENLLEFIKPKMRSIESRAAIKAEPKIDLAGYKQFTNGKNYWAIKGDPKNNTICTVEGVLGGMPSMLCKKYGGKDIKAYVNRQCRKLQKEGWSKIVNPK